VSDLDDFKAQFLPRQAAVELAFAHGDPEPRFALWSRNDHVTLMGAWGPNKIGWDQLSETFR
jgi:hypothetical protein